jgi:hypothetical protein
MSLRRWGHRVEGCCQCHGAPAAPTAQKRQEGSSPGSSDEVCACSNNLWLLTCRIPGSKFSVVLSHKTVVMCYGCPGNYHIPQASCWWKISDLHGFPSWVFHPLSRSVGSPSSRSLYSSASWTYFGSLIPVQKSILHALHSPSSKHILKTSSMLTILTSDICVSSLPWQHQCVTSLSAPPGMP